MPQPKARAPAEAPRNLQPVQTSASGEREGESHSRGRGASWERRQSRRWSCCLGESSGRGRGEVSFEEQCGREREEEVGGWESGGREQASDQERSESDTSYEMNGSAV